MAAYFFDSSALAKLYHPEVGTPEMDKIVQTPGAQVRISRLTVVELPSVFAIKVRTRFISHEDARLLARQFQDDIVAQKFLVTAIREPEFVVAERLVERYAFDLRLPSARAAAQRLSSPDARRMPPGTAAWQAGGPLHAAIPSPPAPRCGRDT